MIFRGVGFGSPAWGAASEGTALTDSKWVQRDYPELDLPSASYWSDPSLLRSEVFWALDHAFGGDFPQPWEQAQSGIILAHHFALRKVAKRPSNDKLKMPDTAWKLSGRDEYLAFADVTNCQVHSPLSFIRAATVTDIEAVILLSSAYLAYLEFQSSYGIDANRASELLIKYRSSTSSA